VAGEPGNARDALWRRLDDTARAALTVPFVPGPDGLRASFPVTVDA
jgi:protocatechuate 3,4-dioxygenase, beta subunit